MYYTFNRRNSTLFHIIFHYMNTFHTQNLTRNIPVLQIMVDICSFIDSKKHVPRGCREATLAVKQKKKSLLVAILFCKYMQILILYISVIAAHKNGSTLLSFGLHCLPYFPLH